MAEIPNGTESIFHSSVIIFLFFIYTYIIDNISEYYILYFIFKCFLFQIMIDQEARFDKWVKKLYTLRQKAIADLTHSNVT